MLQLFVVSVQRNPLLINHKGAQMKTLTKSLTLTAIAAGMAVAVLAPETALARSKSQRHYSASSVSATESRLQALEAEIAALRAELEQARTTVPAKVDEIEAKQQQLEQEVAEDKAHLEEHHNNDLIFFRGGYAQMSHARNNELLLNNDRFNDLGLTARHTGKDGEGWYVGAGLDHRLTDDLWGLTDLVAVDGEIMFQYMNFGSSYNTLVDVATNAFAGAPPSTVTIKNQLTQFTLAASPKVKFNLMDGRLRPWIIPFGLSINVISPPSSGVTVLNPGLMLGTGVEFNIWNNLWAGADFRYNFTGNDLGYKATLPNGATVYNKTNTDGLTAGAYLGFGF